MNQRRSIFIFTEKIPTSFTFILIVNPPHHYYSESFASLSVLRKPLICCHQKISIMAKKSSKLISQYKGLKRKRSTESRTPRRSPKLLPPLPKAPKTKTTKHLTQRKKQGRFTGKTISSSFFAQHFYGASKSDTF